MLTRRSLPKFDIPPSEVRQPPPPRRQGKEEWNTEEEVAPFKLLVPPAVDQAIRCKRKRVTTDIESLPDELLFEVLVRIPVQDVYYEARLVCRKWYHIIHTPNFISSSLHHSTYGLLFKSVCWESVLILPQSGGGGVEVTQLRYKRRCVVLSSCNGLWLENNLPRQDYPYVINPLTGQIVILPPCVGRVSEFKYALAYAPASMEYKAVIFYPPDGIYCAICHMLTAGVDKTWRDIDLGLISSDALKAFHNTPLVTEGFVHWQNHRTHHVLTLNLETETFTETPAPLLPPAIGSDRNIYLSTGGKCLTLLRQYEVCLWQVWEMSRPETGEWRKKAHFSLEAHKERFKIPGGVPNNFLTPVGWVKYPELLAMKARDKAQMSAVFIYNLVTHEIDEIGLPTFIATYRILVHKSSLEWLDAVKRSPSSP
ncbi:Unknown protein [Striga hermonthica]|uniref:F-box domain-containing protein n=1 Tax=Striga hermonthica TaxID=68872 RepID=A0A9N7NXR2_STRHE|nr:Unknown protein [Striga hermonthica]